MSATFEEFLIKCCEAEEDDLRKFLKKILLRNGFRIIEDSYKSPRGAMYSGIHNMLAIRGNNPKICTVAHTDVCRDHGFSGKSLQRVSAVIKEVTINGKPERIIQDKYKMTQVGGDDRLGVAINTWIALNTGYDMGLLFTTDEEIGLISASQCEFPELNEFDLLVQTDRGNHSNQLVTEICGIELCSLEVAIKLLQIAEDIGLPRRAVNGMATDVLCIKANDACRNAVNMTVGYHNSYGDQADEYIILSEAKECLKFVSSIIKHYDLEDYDEEYKVIPEAKQLLQTFTKVRHHHQKDQNINNWSNNTQMDDYEREIEHYETNFWY